MWCSIRPVNIRADTQWLQYQPCQYLRYMKAPKDVSGEQEQKDNALRKKHKVKHMTLCVQSAANTHSKRLCAALTGGGGRLRHVRVPGRREVCVQG